MRGALPLFLLALAGPVQAATVQEVRRQPLSLEVADDGRWSMEAAGIGPLDTLTLAQAWYDREGVHRLLGRDRGAWALLGAQVAAGVALGVGAAFAFAEADHYLPKRSAFSVSRRNYRQREDYLYARQQADLAYEAALAAVPLARRMQAEDKAWTGFSLALSATLVVGLAPAHRLRVQRMVREPDRFYSLEEAQQRLETYNETRSAVAAPVEAWSLVAWPHAVPHRGGPSRSAEAW